MSPQAALIAAAAQAAPALPGCRALFLAGSFGRGTADAMSDVDLVALAAPEAEAALVEAWRAVVERVEPVVFWRDRRRPFRLVNAIGERWLRCDLSVGPAAPPAGLARDTVRVLHDPDRLLADLPATLPPRRPAASVIAETIEEFLRVLGLLPVVAARDEWFTAAEGTAHLRRAMTRLLLEEAPCGDPGGALHLGAALPPGRLALLAALPHPAPTREAVLAAHRDLARTFLPVARALAGRTGVEWPLAFEIATRRRLRETLGLEI